MMRLDSCCWGKVRLPGSHWCIFTVYSFFSSAEEPSKVFRFIPSSLDEVHNCALDCIASTARQIVTGDRAGKVHLGERESNKTGRKSSLIDLLL